MLVSFCFCLVFGAVVTDVQRGGISTSNKEPWLAVLCEERLMLMKSGVLFVINLKSGVLFVYLWVCGLFILKQTRKTWCFVVVICEEEDVRIPCPSTLPWISLSSRQLEGCVAVWCVCGEWARQYETVSHFCSSLYTKRITRFPFFLEEVLSAYFSPTHPTHSK